MKIISVIITLLIGFVLAGIGARMVPEAQMMEWIGLAYENSVNLLIVGLTGAVLILIVLSGIYSFFRKLREKKGVTFANPEGQVKITLLAIEDFIRRSVSEIKEVKNLKPKAEVRKKGIRILNKVTLWSGANLPEVSNNIQSMIRKRLEEMLGIENIDSVNVFVTKIIPRKKKAKEEEEPSFTGNIEYGEGS